MSPTLLHIIAARIEAQYPDEAHTLRDIADEHKRLLEFADEHVGDAFDVAKTIARIRVEWSEARR